jgi:hypothetical protein
MQRIARLIGQVGVTPPLIVKADSEVEPAASGR